jgi:hypothetical protein
MNASRCWARRREMFSMHWKRRKDTVQPISKGWKREIIVTWHGLSPRTTLPKANEYNRLQNDVTKISRKNNTSASFAKGRDETADPRETLKRTLLWKAENDLIDIGLSAIYSS